MSNDLVTLINEALEDASSITCQYDKDSYKLGRVQGVLKALSVALSTSKITIVQTVNGDTNVLY